MMTLTWTPVFWAMTSLSTFSMLVRPFLSKRSQRRNPGATGTAFGFLSMRVTPTGGRNEATCASRAAHGVSWDGCLPLASSSVRAPNDAPASNGQQLSRVPGGQRCGVVPHAV